MIKISNGKFYGFIRYQSAMALYQPQLMLIFCCSIISLKFDLHYAEVFVYFQKFTVFLLLTL